MTDSATTTGMDSPEKTHEYPDYGGNPLAHVLSSTDSVRLAPFGGAFQPGLYKPPPFKFGNPVPLGLAGFALTTFILSCINLGVRDIKQPSIVIAPSLAYGGFIQVLAGMWDIALGNVFGGTALTSYGGFWISIGIILTPGGFHIETSYANAGDFYAAFGLYLFGWFIFTFLLWLMTLKSTLAFSSLFGTVCVVFLCLGIAYLNAQNSATYTPTVALVRVAGAFGIVASFLAWWNMLAGIADPGNSLFSIPVVHFPWSEKAREGKRKKRDREAADSDEGMV